MVVVDYEVTVPAEDKRSDDFEVAVGFHIKVPFKTIVVASITIVVAGLILLRVRQ